MFGKRHDELDGSKAGGVGGAVGKQHYDGVEVATRGNALCCTGVALHAAQQLLVVGGLMDMKEMCGGTDVMNL